MEIQKIHEFFQFPHQKKEIWLIQREILKSLSERNFFNDNSFFCLFEKLITVLHPKIKIDGLEWIFSKSLSTEETDLFLFKVIPWMAKEALNVNLKKLNKNI